MGEATCQKPVLDLGGKEPRKHLRIALVMPRGGVEVAHRRPTAASSSEAPDGNHIRGAWCRGSRTGTSCSRWPSLSAPRGLPCTPSWALKARSGETKVSTLPSATEAAWLAPSGRSGRAWGREPSCTPSSHGGAAGGRLGPVVPKVPVLKTMTMVATIAKRPGRLERHGLHTELLLEGAAREPHLRARGAEGAVLEDHAHDGHRLQAAGTSSNVMAFGVDR